MPPDTGYYYVRLERGTRACVCHSEPSVRHPLTTCMEKRHTRKGRRRDCLKRAQILIGTKKKKKDLCEGQIRPWKTLINGKEV